MVTHVTLPKLSKKYIIFQKIKKKSMKITLQVTGSRASYLNVVSM